MMEGYHEQVVRGGLSLDAYFRRALTVDELLYTIRDGQPYIQSRDERTGEVRIIFPELGSVHSKDSTPCTFDGALTCVMCKRTLGEVLNLPRKPHVAPR